MEDNFSTDGWGGGGDGSGGNASDEEWATHLLLCGLLPKRLLTGPGPWPGGWGPPV